MGIRERSMRVTGNTYRDCEIARKGGFKLQKPWTAVSIVMVLAAVTISYSLYYQQQALLKIKFSELANHAAQAGDAFRVLKVEPQSEYDRYRALFHLQSLKIELSNLGSFAQSQTYVTGIDQRLIEEELDEDRVTKLSESLFEAEQALGELSNRKFIGKSKIREVLSKMEVNCSIYK